MFFVNAMSSVRSATTRLSHAFLAELLYLRAQLFEATMVGYGRHVIFRPGTRCRYPLQTAKNTIPGPDSANRTSKPGSRATAPQAVPSSWYRA